MQTEHPIQPIITDGDGVVRFKANKIVSHLLDHGGIDMNALARLDFADEDREQFAQLIGYSLSGFGSLSYVSDQAYAKAAAAVAGARHPNLPAVREHDLYTDADKDRPDAICDSNGQVALSLCKKCGKGECELVEPCVANPEPRVGSSIATDPDFQRLAYELRAASLDELSQALPALVAFIDTRTAGHCDAFSAGKQAVVNALRGHLFLVTDSVWPYLHGNCTIQSVHQRFREARAAIGARPVPEPKFAENAMQDRQRFEQACYDHYLERHAAGKLTDSAHPANTIEQLMWRDENGNYGVKMCNASWWAWQAAGKP